MHILHDMLQGPKQSRFGFLFTTFNRLVPYGVFDMCSNIPCSKPWTLKEEFVLAFTFGKCGGLNAIRALREALPHRLGIDILSHWYVLGK